MTDMHWDCMRLVEKRMYFLPVTPQRTTFACEPKSKTVRNFLLAIGLMIGAGTFAQCPPVLTCGSNLNVNNDPGKCGANIVYCSPVGLDTCVNNTLSFNYTGTIDTFIVPSGVTSIFMRVKGAQGGNSTWGTLRTGGLGASVSGDVTVTCGDTLLILVGQQGESDAVGGGGGGSFVATTQGVPLMIAGGGGGASSDQNGVDAPVTTAGTMDSQNIINGGTGGNGGSACAPPSQNNGGGGGGFLTDGQDANTGTSFNGGFGGKSFLNGGAGGVPGRLAGGCSQDAFGGFGGGGSTSCNTVGGGGGGGYSGGAGGPHISQCGVSTRAGGGGGGSFNAGTNTVDSAGIKTGNGEIYFVWKGVSVTTTQTAGLPSGAMFPVGTTTNTFVTSNTNGSDTCSFTITVTDTGQITSLAPLSQDTICTTAGNLTLPSGTPAGGNYSGTGVTGNSFDPAVAQQGSHWIYYTDTVGCQHTDSVLITVVWCTGIQEGVLSDVVKISPNPSNGLFNLNIPQGDHFEKLELYDAVGRRVWVANDPANTKMVDIRQNAKGVYYLNVELNGMTETFRLIKK